MLDGAEPLLDAAQWLLGGTQRSINATINVAVSESTVMVWEAGKQLYGKRYTIERQLGEGGFGITYLATKSNGQRVVIKIITEQILQREDFPKFQECFIAEALRLAVCKHPNIVEVENTFTHDERFCIAMEYVEGEDLGKLVKKQGYLSETEALQYIWQIGDALTYSHQEKGLLHRDVTPPNIMRRRGSDRVVLIDFGLARGFIPGLFQNLTVSRNFYFAPPEQFDPKAQQQEYTDVYALAATLYYLLTAKSPAPAIARMRPRKQNPLTPPRQFNPDICERVQEAIFQGMALDEKSRPQSVQEWLAMLPQVTPKLNVRPVRPAVTTPAPAWTDSEPTFVITVNSRGEEIKRERRQAEYFREDLGNGVFLDMVSIPGGSFMMGSPTSERGFLYLEGPQHRRAIAAFSMGKYPITQAQWKAVAALPQIKHFLKSDPSSFKGDNLPVERVSWYQAVEFCKRLSRKTGRNYRLPSEAEWEYACRAGTTTPFHFGETITANLANYNGNYPYYHYPDAPKGESRQKTTEVGSFPANAFGLYDMHGNVWEWCADPWHKNYEDAPADGRVWQSGGDDSFRMLRGGSLGYNAWLCRSACRLREDPGARFGPNGLRLVAVSPVQTR